MLATLLAILAVKVLASSRRISSQTNGFPIAATTERSTVELADNRGFYPFLFGEANTWAYQTFIVQVPENGALITITDAFCAGDRFEVWANGRRIDRKATWEGVKSEDCEIYEVTPFEAWNDIRFNSGTYFLLPGRRQLTIRVLESPIGGGMGFAFYGHTLEYGRAPLCHLKEECNFGYDPTAPWELYQKKNDTIAQ